MNKQAVIDAYGSYLLYKNASEEMMNDCAQADDIVEILRILSETYPCRAETGFEKEELCYVEKCFFAIESNEDEMYGLLKRAEAEGKAAKGDGLSWKYVSPISTKV